MAQKVNVKSAFKEQKDGGFPLAIFEQHEAHPDGELYIADDKVHSVALTPGVKEALKEGRLVDAEEGQASGDEDNEEVLRVEDDDDVDSLTQRYDRAELERLAVQEGISEEDAKKAKDKPTLAGMILDEQ